MKRSEAPQGDLAARPESGGTGLADRIRRIVGDPLRSFFAEPPKPSLPGDHLEPGFRRRWLGFLLPATFLIFWTLYLAQGLNGPLNFPIVGFDAHIYYRGSAAWLAGQNPWATGAALAGHHFSYAGLPPTVVLLSPLTLLPEEAFLWLWLVASFVAAIVVVRALRLPIGWIAYPPMMFGVMSANPNVVLLALILAGGAWGGAAASAIKVIAIPPLVGERRWRALLAVAAVLGASVVLFPGLWSSFLNQAATVQSAISAESEGGFSAWGSPYLFLPTIAALAILARIDLRAAAWLVVPALFPTSQYHYAMFALPVDPFLAAGMAIPLRQVAPIMTIAYTAIRVGLLAWRRSGRSLPAGLAVGPPAGER
ncbi:MAG TPA: hypothetical protein VF349_03305 [Candidatus Limnocylindrales bacterium]